MEPIHDASWGHCAAPFGKDDRAGCWPSDGAVVALQCLSKVRMHRYQPAVTVFGDAAADRQVIRDYATGVECHGPGKPSYLARS